MALRLFNQINSKFFRYYKTQSLAPSIKDTETLQEAEEQVDLLARDLSKKHTDDSKVNITTNALKYWKNDLKTTLMSVTKPMPPFTLGPMLNQARFYTKPPSDKCKEQQARMAKCKKFKLCNCRQTLNPRCKVSVQPTKCKKKEAPYPSFSEACYEEPYNKPSECKLCPWKPENNPSFKGSIVIRKLHTGRSWIPNNSILRNEENEVAQELASEKSAKVWNQSTTLSPIIGGNVNIIDVTRPSNLALFCKKKKGTKSSGKCKKFPFKKLKPKKKKDKKGDGCEKKPCIKKKRKLIKDCPPEDLKKCSQWVNADIFKGDILKKSIVSINLKKDKGVCDGNKHQVCEVDDSDKKKCPKKRKGVLNCPTKSLLQKPGYQRKPKKNKKKTSAVDEAKDLLLIPNPIYNGGVIYNNTLRPSMVRPT